MGMATVVGLCSSVNAAMTEQATELATSAQKLTAGTTQPLAGVTSLFKQAS